MNLIGREENGWRVSDGQVSLVRGGQSRPVRVEARPQPIELDLARTALIVVDMQNDFLSPGGWLDSVGVDVSSVSALVDPLNEATRVLRSQEVKIIWLNWGNRKDQANLPPGVLHVYDPDGKGCGIGSSLANGSKVLEAGSWSAALVDGVETGATDFFVDKYRMSGFFDTPLDSILRNLAVTTVLFAGVNIDQCVYGTLIDAACLGYDVILLEDISGTTSPSYCFEATIYNVAQCYGFVTTSRSLIEALKR